ncbi:MAG: DUF4136 domain-containing protein [Rhodospirillales bacterium]|nr:DUF4136 domain-containing protein [Rhodospirillales bacterium]
MAELVKHMVVQTSYDVEEINEEANVFNDFSTFVLRLDTIGFITPFSTDTLLLDDTNHTTKLPTVDFVSEVTHQINDRIEERGFERVLESEDPDFGVKVVILEQFSFFQPVSYPGYYSGYYGYYGGYYGPVVNTYSSNFVTMVIEVVDIKNYQANNFRYKVIWSSYIGDLITSADRNTKIQEAIEQAFIQSPYFSQN